MKKLDSFVKERNIIASDYNDLFSGSQIDLPKINSENYSSWHLYIIRISNNNELNRDSVFEKLRNNGIYVNVHYIPIYRQPYYQKMNFKLEDYPESEKFYEEAISIPIFPGLEDKQKQKIISIISEPFGYQNLF